jgi:hypothetical protein
MRLYRSYLHCVEVTRVHKSSPYNCVAYIPVIINKDRYAVIDMDEVSEAIKGCYGKSFIVNINTQSETSFLQYKVGKSAAEKGNGVLYYEGKKGGKP